MHLSSLPALRAALTAALIFGTATALQAQTLQADYQVQQTLASSVGTIGPLTLIGGITTPSYTSTTVNGNPQFVLSIRTTTSQTPPFISTGAQAQTANFGISPTNYSAVLLASFDLTTTGAVATKVFDFKNLSSDAGLYINNATGVLEFIDGSGVVQGAPSNAGLVTSNTYLQLVLTRDSATNLVSVFENGTLALSFTDNGGLATLGDATATGNAFLTLFKDDGMGLGGTLVNEGTQGNIARFRIYDGVLSATDVQNIGTTIPEPSTWALIGIGVIGFGGALLRRRFSVA